MGGTHDPEVSVVQHRDHGGAPSPNRGQKHGFGMSSPAGTDEPGSLDGCGCRQDEVIVDVGDEERFAITVTVVAAIRGGVEDARVKDDQASSAVRSANAVRRISSCC